MKALPVLASVLLLADPLVAGTTAITPGPQTVMSTTTDEGWEFTLGLYGWGAGLNGDIGAAGYSAPVDISFSEILDTLDMTAMGMVELRKNRWLFQLEGLYLRNSIKNTLAYTPIRNTPVNAKLTAETTRIEAVVGYRLIENECTTLDALAGAVYYDISNEIQLFGVAGTTGVTSQEAWLDPIIGLRLNQRLSDRWSLQMRGEIGGFGVNADLAWQAVGLFGYDLTDSSAMFAGWRIAAVDYQNGGFLYDVYSSGPILGLAIRW